MIIVIDGPSGTGKSTIATILAKKLAFDYFDTGAMYRAATYLVLKNNIDVNDDEKIQALLELNFNYEIKPSSKKDKDLTRGDEKRYFLNNEDISEKIRSFEITKNVSVISSKHFVRTLLVHIQKEAAKNRNCVFEGRDMGTIVFPNADYKFFLTATAEIRAKRRYLQLIEKDPSLEKTLDITILEENIKKRDFQDSNRDISPLKQASDAVLVDTSKMSIDIVVEYLLSEISLKSD
jgi:CMP/dCMP kinase